MDITAHITDQLLLDHPFYRRWEAGELDATELGSYAAQYRFFEAQLPSFLASLATLLEGDAKALVEANLADEVGGPATHLELFDVFAAAVNAPAEEISPAMAELVAVYQEAVATGDAARALGVLAGYEVQAADIAETKGAGLAAHYGVTGSGLDFWTLHAGVEQEHAAWTTEAAATVDEEAFLVGVRQSATAWWGYLDEREALVAA